MTPTEKGRRRDALLYGFDTRLQLCDMIVNREADLEDARAENAKLVVKLNAEHLVRQNAERDNAKLRELVRIAIEYCVNGYCAEEDECPLYESRHHCRLCAEARELGVDA